MKRRLQALSRFRSLGTDTLWSLGQDGTVVVVGLVTFLMIPKALGTEDYGLYLGAYGAIAPLTGLAWAGVSLVILQKILREKDDPADVLARALGLAVATALVAAVAAFALASVLIPELGTVELLGLIGVEALGTTTIGLFGSTIQATGGFAPAARLRISQQLVKLVVVGGLFASDALTIRNLALGLTLGSGLLAAHVLLVRMPALGIDVGLRRPTAADARVTGFFSLPILVSSMQTDGDKTALAAYGFRDIAGQYGAAFKLVQFAMMPINAFDGAAFQRFLPHDPDARGQHLRRAVHSAAVTVPFALMIVTFLFFAAPLLPILVGDTFGDSVTMTRWLLVFIPLFAITTAPMNALIGLGHLVRRVVIHVVAALVSVGCYVVLIPQIDWRGGLIGTLAGELVIAVGGWWSLVVLQRRHDLALDRTPPPEAGAPTPGSDQPSTTPRKDHDVTIEG